MVSTVDTKSSREVRHTIEAVLQLSSTPELGTFNFLTWKESVQGQAEDVVTHRAKEGLSVEQARKPSPSHLLLQLIKVEAVWVQ